MLTAFRTQVAQLLIVVLTMLPLADLYAGASHHSGDDGQHSTACPMHQNSDLNSDQSDTLCGGMGCDMCGICAVAALAAMPEGAQRIGNVRLVETPPHYSQLPPGSPFRPPRIASFFS